MGYPAFIEEYAKKHHMYIGTVEGVPLLNDAALLEWRVRNQDFSVYEARRRLVKQYPKTNRIPTSAIIVNAGGDIFNSSVLLLIKRYKDAIPREDWNYKDKE